MPRKTRRQLVGKQEDAEREQREDALRALERELHQPQSQQNENSLPVIREQDGIIVPLVQAKIMPLTVHA
jgi:hypothetical protein